MVTSEAKGRTDFLHGQRRIVFLEGRKEIQATRNFQGEIDGQIKSLNGKCLCYPSGLNEEDLRSMP